MTALGRLAERCGIQHSSEDAFGKEHVISDETKRALLKAMYLTAENEEQAEASLAEIEAAEWNTAFSPVLVAYDTGQPALVALVRRKGTGAVSWKVQYEGEGTCAGTVSFDSLSLLRTRKASEGDLEQRLLPLPADLPWGYHRLSGDGEEETSLIVTPGRCWLPPQADGSRRLWGISAQLYLLRSRSNWGIGDLTDLRELVEIAAHSSADTVGINPVHAMFPDDPEQASPYSPSDRLLLNILLIDVNSVAELAESPEAQALIAADEFQQRLAMARDAALVDYTSVAALKMPVLKALFRTFEERNDTARQTASEAFCEDRGELLQRACIFQALHAQLTGGCPELADCSRWPEDLRSVSSPGVRRFAKEHSELVRFQLWLQWIADEQLQAASIAAKGMAIGLYRDLAVGAHASGAEVWSYPEALVSGASVGAPPDIWNPSGQNWGLPPLHPLGARKMGYRSFIELLQANMRYAGALRIDHALALQRLYWIPQGQQSKDGAYVRYATDDLVGILALESHRNQCVVIGEDLGTVPAGFRERMERGNILSYRVLFFERDAEGFTAPEEYPRLSLSVASSHDLPTLCGWWSGSDIDLKERLHLFPETDGAEKARATRTEDREALVAALEKESLLKAGDALAPKRFCDATHRFLLRTNSLLTLVQLDDLSLEEQQVNVPASEGNPNWRRKLTCSLEDFASKGILAHTAAMTPVHDRGLSAAGVTAPDR